MNIWAIILQVVVTAGIFSSDYFQEPWYYLPVLISLHFASVLFLFLRKKDLRFLFLYIPLFLFNSYLVILTLVFTGPAGPWLN